LIAGVAVITVALVSLCAYAALPIYSATCTIRNNDDGTLMMEFIKRHPNAHPSAY
jgi:cytochrome c oxidase assembly protein Cox11